MSTYYNGPYDYSKSKPELFTEEGSRNFLRVRDRAMKLLAEAGAFSLLKATQDVSGDSYTQLMYVDRLVELGEIREITGPNVAGQHRVFVKA